MELFEIIKIILLFIVLLGVLVTVHEFGHFIAAKLSGMRAEVFCVGMGKRLVGWNKITGFTFGSLPEDIELGDHTDYRIAPFPLGGFVKISGMIDESFDEEFVNSEPQPYEFRSKNAFLKAFAISNGVIMNFIFAILVFAGMAFFIGEEIYDTTKIAHVNKETLADKSGIKAGDQVLQINDRKINNWMELSEAVHLENFGNNCVLKVKRNDEIVDIKIDGQDRLNILVNKKSFGIILEGNNLFFPEIFENSPAEKAGLIANDTLISMAGQRFFSHQQFSSYVQNNKGKSLDISWKRGNQIMSGKVTPSPEGTIGIQIRSHYSGPRFTREFGFFESIPYGMNKTYEAGKMILQSIWQMIKGKIAFKDSVGGPVAIAKAALFNWELGVDQYIRFLALFSIMLGLINIFPFPALDGGHLIIIIFEAIFRREMPVTIRMRIQQVGMFILLGFMAFVIVNDFLR